MMPLTYLEQLCSQIDRCYNVSLQYGAHAGEKPCWMLTAGIPSHHVNVVRHMATLKNILVEAQTLGGEIESLASLKMAVKHGEEKIGLDIYQATQGDGYSTS